MALTWIAEEIEQDAGKGSRMKGKTSIVQMVNANGGEEMYSFSDQYSVAQVLTKQGCQQVRTIKENLQNRAI